MKRSATLPYVLAFVAPVAATGLARLIPHHGTAVPAVLYLLTVVGVASFGLLRPALVASAVSVLALDFFFTPPVHRITVDKAEDLITLSVFFGVAAVVSAAVSASIEHRARAELRERQLRAVYHATASLVSGERPETVLRDLAGSLRRLLGVAGCRVVMESREGWEGIEAVSGQIEGQSTVVPLSAEGAPIGRVELWDAEAPRFGEAEGQVLETLGAELALVLTRFRLDEEANRARLEAEASRVRAALFSSVTHDLRTPLASIKASASSLVEAGVPFSEEQRRELLQTILEEAERLNRLVANLMDLARVRAGALVLTLDTVPFEDLVAAVLSRLGPQLSGHPVRVNVRGDVPPVAVDVVQMDQVLTNLVENAAKYSPLGSEITISVLRWQRMVEVRVADRGPGIAREDRDKVFQEFYRRDAGAGRGGAGLGLAIAQAIVLAHGGSMWIEDTPGGGATVGLRVPVEASRPVSAVADRGAPE